MQELLKSNLTPSAAVKVMVNVGATMDIPTGIFVRGIHGEHILLGGIGYLEGITGVGNSFKTTIARYKQLSAASRIMLGAGMTSIQSYDTEMNIHEDRQRRLSQQHEAFKDSDILADGTWTITDKSVYYGNEWFEKLKEYLKTKKDNGSKLTVPTPFLNRDGKTLMEILIPTFGDVDSFSEFETSDVAKIMDENELGDSGGNTIHMRQGLAKTRFLMEMPALGASTNHFTFLSAHLGKNMNIAAGPYAPPPTKKLQHMGQDDKVKGVTDKFYFLTTTFMQTKSVSKLINQATKAAEYPRNSDDNISGDTDLNEVSVIILRSKSGPSGMVLNIVVSQTDGVLPSLTEFNYIKNSDRFGINGSLQNYCLDLYPDCRLSRTVVRGKIDSDAKLRRALNITSELCQMRQYYRTLKVPDPKTVYDGIKANGYDWDFILEKTRGWWTVNNDSLPTYFLSTMDIIRMSYSKDSPDFYHPYWMEEDCKTVKKKYLNH